MVRGDPSKEDPLRPSDRADSETALIERMIRRLVNHHPTRMKIVVPIAIILSGRFRASVSFDAKVPNAHGECHLQVRRC